jgi:hypothetical protein
MSLCSLAALRFSSTLARRLYRVSGFSGSVLADGFTKTKTTPKPNCAILHALANRVERARMAPDGERLRRPAGGTGRAAGYEAVVLGWE